jgi:hypothetical protein
VIESTWRNMNLSLQLCQPTPLTSPSHLSSEEEKSPQQKHGRELKRLGSDLSEVMHVASIRSSQSFNQSSRLLNPTESLEPIDLSAGLDIPPEILAMRNRKKQQKFMFRLAKGTNWRSRLINYLFWDLTASSGFEQLDPISEDDRRLLTASEGATTHTDETTSTTKNYGLLSWRISQSSTKEEINEWPEPGEQSVSEREDNESDVFTTMKSEPTTSSREEDTGWEIFLFDQFQDIDDSTSLEREREQESQGDERESSSGGGPPRPSRQRAFF